MLGLIQEGEGTRGEGLSALMFARGKSKTYTGLQALENIRKTDEVKKVDTSAGEHRVAMQIGDDVAVAVTDDIQVLNQDPAAPTIPLFYTREDEGDAITHDIDVPVTANVEFLMQQVLGEKLANWEMAFGDTVFPTSGKFPLTSCLADVGIGAEAMIRFQKKRALRDLMGGKFSDREEAREHILKVCETIDMEWFELGFIPALDEAIHNELLRVDAHIVAGIKSMFPPGERMYNESEMFLKIYSYRFQLKDLELKKEVIESDSAPGLEPDGGWIKVADLVSRGKLERSRRRSAAPGAAAAPSHHEAHVEIVSRRVNFWPADPSQRLALGNTSWERSPEDSGKNFQHIATVVGEFQLSNGANVSVDVNVLLDHREVVFLYVEVKLNGRLQMIMQLEKGDGV